MKTNRWEIALLVTAVVAPGVWLTIQQEPNSILSSAPPNTERSPSPDPSALAAWEKIQPHLSAAEKEANEVVNKHCDRVSDFFAERSKRARAFAERALSYGSKWAFAKSKLPFTDGDGHRKYLHERFETLVFSSTELEEVLQSAVQGCVVDLQAIENALLVKVRADLSDDALGAIREDLRFSTETAFREEYARAVENARKTIAKDLPVWAGREALTWVGADLTAPVIHSLAVSVIGRLGLSGGILGSGAASGAITLGGGVIAGLVIDALLDRLLLALGYDPAANIEKQVVEALEYCEELILDGKAAAEVGQALRTPWLNAETMRGNPPPALKKPAVPAKKEAADEGEGLFYYLSVLSCERTILRNGAIKNLVLEGGGK
jgi:hypothetical protein